jgi:hypothetical protein
MGEETGALERAKAEALAAFAAIAALVDLSGEPETTEHNGATDALRAAAAGHLSAALRLVGGAKGGGA